MYLDLKDVQKKGLDYFDSYDAICYGGWAMAEKIVKSRWFLERAEIWKNKRLAMFCVGGMSYEKMSAPTRITMKMFVSAISNKKDATEEQKEMFERMASSYDISDIKYIEPIADYLVGMNEEKAV